jgi:cytochrome oxidase Cu insertion factor (SCO1/SenC/PrrC family)
MPQSGRRGRLVYWPHFELASGSAEEVRAAADFFGVSFWNEAGQIVHDFCTAVIDAEGRLAARFDGNEWTADELLSAVRGAAAPAAPPHGPAPVPAA